MAVIFRTFTCKLSFMMEEYGWAELLCHWCCLEKVQTDTGRAVNVVYLPAVWWCDSRKGGGEKSSGNDRDSAAVATQSDRCPLLRECSSSSRATGPKCQQRGRRCNTPLHLSPNYVFTLLSPNNEELLVEYWDTTQALRAWLLLLLTTVLEKLYKHPGITFSVSKPSILLFQVLAFWTFKYSRNNKRERGSGGRRTLFIARELFPVHRSGTPPLLIVRRALDPLISAHINLVKYIGYYCNVCRAAPLLLFSHLSAGWMKAQLLGKQPSLISFTDEFPGWLHALPASFH